MAIERRRRKGGSGNIVKSRNDQVPRNSVTVTEPSWPGLSRPSTSCFNLLMGGWVYFMTNRRNGVLYVGVTSNLPQRAFQHRDGVIKGFTKQYGLKALVYFEQFDDIRDAIQREKTIKHWPRAWKVRLIHGMNPEWKDLYDTLA
jgi:putative endonuclease